MPVFPRPSDQPSSEGRAVQWAKRGLCFTAPPFTGQRQVYVFPSNWWQIQVTAQAHEAGPG